MFLLKFILGAKNVASLEKAIADAEIATKQAKEATAKANNILDKGDFKGFFIGGIVSLVITVFACGLTASKKN